ncbi:heterokaryon incompatibility protein-domain-containing protein [Schizothecium vesticola]|uniref:Heterokaryon incompatibility protein-domain-containing protein n=1 Tax=Schizothecium vesticola TaxID=314040 RepID=A0AA40F424_9PEZI|nr:heterokaryon incompatibility protein-domain-containing protein [Schizothecium vesticola]
MDAGGAEAPTLLPKLEDFVDSLLKARLRLLQPVIVPQYLESFAHAGFSTSQLPPWPEDETVEDEMQSHVTALISRLIELACQPPNGVQSLPRASRTSATSTSLAVTFNPPPLYAPLALDKSQKNIRLLTILPGTEPRISCFLEVASLHAPGSYDALSYVWGAPLPSETVLVNGAMVDVGPSLHSALAALRLPDQPSRIWADAICINQLDNNEKSWQVAMMAEIYRHAETVRVFVGDEGDTATLFRFLNRDVIIGEGIDKAAERCEIPILNLLRAYVDFSLRPWFSRVWVYQEFLLASRSPVWHCGVHSAVNDSLRRDLEMLYTRCVEYQSPLTGDIDYNFAGDLGYDDFTLKLNDVTAIVFILRLSDQYRSIPAMEYKRRRRVSTDPRDLVFGLRELFEPAFQHIFYPDYTLSHGDLFLRLSAWLLALDQWGDVFEAYPLRCSPDLPSWVRDFTRLPTVRQTLGEEKLPLAMPCSIYNQVLSVDGVELDEIAQTFVIDEDNTSALIGKLWHLDQLFTTKSTRATSVLSPLDTTESMYTWAMGKETNRLGEVIPESMVLIRVAQVVINPQLRHAEAKYYEPEPPTDSTLQEPPYDDAMAVLAIVATERSRWLNRIKELTSLLNFIVKSMYEEENILAASLYDHDSFAQQIKAYVSNPSPKISSSTPTPTNEGGDGKLTYGPGTISYPKTVEFIRNCGPGMVELLLEISQALHTGTFANQDIWDLTTPDFLPELDEQIKHIDKLQRNVVASLPPTSTEGETQPAASESVPTRQGLDTTADFISRCIQRRDELNRLRDTAPQVMKFGNAPRGLAKALGEHSMTLFHHCTFFVTKGGLPGVGTPGMRDVQPGDKLVWLKDMYHPLVVRASSKHGGQHFEIGGTVVVRGIMGGRLRPSLGENMPPLRKFTFV